MDKSFTSLQAIDNEISEGQDSLSHLKYQLQDPQTQRVHQALKIYKWQPDIVTVFPGKLFSLPFINSLLSPLTMFETQLFTKWAPFFSSSLIVLAFKYPVSPDEA